MGMLVACVNQEMHLDASSMAGKHFFPKESMPQDIKWSMPKEWRIPVVYYYEGIDNVDIISFCMNDKRTGVVT